jgi:hypothetical protein
MVLTSRKLAWAAVGMICSAAMATSPMPARADQAAAALVVRHLEAGTLADGASALGAILAGDPGNQEARFGLGAIQFVTAIEHLSQGLYRYGLQSPTRVRLPILRLPVPVNPNPEKITYDAFRGILQAFVNDLATADATLAVMGTVEFKQPVDLNKIRYDADGNGTAAENERLVSVIGMVAGLSEDEIPTESFVVAFDLADGIWLRGYSHVLMSLGEFLLAYDWRESFELGFHMFFPKSDFAFEQALAPADDEFVAPIADLISFFHLRWKLSEPDRMKAVHNHFKSVISLSRQNWDAIEAESDDDREWLPSPRQNGPFEMLRVTEDQVRSWRAMLTEAEKVLEGNLLVPHWRLLKGLNLKRAFLEPTDFDLVLWITGPAALPYLEDGPVTTAETWALMTSAFEGGFGMYAIWFN